MTKGEYEAKVAELKRAIAELAVESNTNSDNEPEGGAVGMGGITSVDDVYKIGAYEVLPLDKLFADATYQREPSRAKVKRIAASFNHVVAGVLIVNRRPNGTYALMDGNHRYLAMKEIGLTEARCIVTRGLSVKEEADVFITCATARKAPLALEVFRARLAAGDPTALAIKRIVEECGYELDLRSGGSGLLKGINAVNTLDVIYASRGEELLRKTLKTIQRTWTTDHEAKGGMMIKGLAHFLHLYPEVYIEEFIEKLQMVPIAAIFQLAGSYHLRNGKKGQTFRYLSMALLDKYNHKKRNRLPDRHVGRGDSGFEVKDEGDDDAAAGSLARRK